MATHQDFQPFPKLNSPLVDAETGNISLPWYRLLISLWQRLGGSANSAPAAIFGQEDPSGVMIFNSATGAQIGIGPVSFDIPIADGEIVANISGALAVPEGTTLTSLLDHDLGVTVGDVAVRGASVWGLGQLNNINGVLGLGKGGSGANLSATGGTHQFVRQDTAGGVLTVGQPSSADVAGTATNDSAPVGGIGQYASSIVLAGGAVPLTSGVPANVSSLPLTAGDWDVSGGLGLVLGGGTTVSDFKSAISLTSATLPTWPGDNSSLAEMPGAGVLALSPCRVSLAATTTVYLVASATFAVSTAAGYGIIRARRVR